MHESQGGDAGAVEGGPQGAVIRLVPPATLLGYVLRNTGHREGRQGVGEVSFFTFSFWILDRGRRGESEKLNAWFTMQGAAETPKRRATPVPY